MSSAQWNVSGLLPGIIGPLSGGSDNQYRQLRLSKDGSLVNSPGHGEFYEACARNKTNVCMNSAAGALSLTGTTTYTGMVVYNPTGSGLNFSLQTAMWLQTTLTTGVGGIMLFSQPIASTVPTLTATGVAGSPFSGMLGGGGASAAKVASSCTLAANPVFARPLLSVPWITAVAQTMVVHKDAINGELVVPPGGAVGFVAITTAVTGIAYLSWEEVPV